MHSSKLASKYDIFNSISLQPGIKGITGLRHQIAKICKFEHVIVNKVMGFSFEAILANCPECL